MSVAGLGLVVLVWDRGRPRTPAVGAAVKRCGARPDWVEDLSAIRQARGSPGATVALVALSGCPSPESPEVEGIRHLRQRGFKILAYGDGVASWPIGRRCLALLAGASWLLDRGERAFPRELHRRLSHLLEVEAQRRDDEQRIKGVMKDLGVVGESAAMLSVFRWTLRVSALSDLPALITGETGTGKELIARALHRLDPKRRHGPFIAINCGALTAGLAQSELFGHRRGAFTGADQSRQGLFRAAQGGILFLDEIAELEPPLQVKLLRALQENRVLGLGEEREVAVDVRVVAATNRDLARMVEKQEFRADLFHRLNVLSVHVAPLRERPDDLRSLVEHFLRKYSHLAPGGGAAAHPEFIEALEQIELRGNARQLENLLRQALVSKRDAGPLELSDLPPEIWGQLSGQGSGARHEPLAAESDERPRAAPAAVSEAASSIVSLLDVNAWNLSRTLDHCERLLLEAALRRTGGNQARTAQLLGITPRSVYNKLHKHQRL